MFTERYKITNEEKVFKKDGVLIGDKITEVLDQTIQFTNRLWVDVDVIISEKRIQFCGMISINYLAWDDSKLELTLESCYYKVNNNLTSWITGNLHSSIDFVSFFNSPDGYWDDKFSSAENRFYNLFNNPELLEKLLMYVSKYDFDIPKLLLAYIVSEIQID